MEPLLKEKTWKKEFEKEIYEKWKSEEPYRFNPDTDKPIYSIDTPPPYVNTPVHIGHAATYSVMDMFARYRRMTGYEVLFPLGLDRNGLPIEMAAERKFNVRLTEIPREKAIELCKKILAETSLASVRSFLRCGISFNSWKIGPELGQVYLTDSPEYRALTQATFIDMWKRGLIYEATRINNWCPGCRTTIADAEIVYKERPTYFNYVSFKVKETGEKIIIATTRPELICTCAMVIFNPNDERYLHLDGKTAITPLYEKEVPIKAHPLAEPEKGTGLVMMCSAGDLSDIRFFREMGLEPIIAINQDGTMNEHSGFLKGLKVEEAREEIVRRLQKEGLLVKRESAMQRVPVCERSGHQIEFIAMPEFYVKQVEYKQKMKELAMHLQFFAPESRNILLDWIDSVSMDWPISRRRIYATEIPLWYCADCGEPFLPPKGKYYQPWRQSPASACKKCGCTKFKGEERVFDTWFDSSISPLYVLGYGRYDEFFKRAAPCSLRPQGKDIIRTWLYYTLLKCWLLTNKRIFNDVWINHMIVDEHGNKMSKSKGNIITPEDVLDRYGAEPFRLWIAVEGNLERTDFHCSFARIEGAGKTLIKLWNVARFISTFEEKPRPSELCNLDIWVINELNRLVELARQRYERYDFHQPAVAIKHFIWETFASNYLELVKNRAYNSEGKFNEKEVQSAHFTFHQCLKTLLKLLAPIIPMFTYKVYSVLYGRDIHKETFPSVIDIPKAHFKTKELIALNRSIWKAKKERGFALNAPIKAAVLPETFKCIEKDLVEAHKIKSHSFGKNLHLEF